MEGSRPGKSRSSSPTSKVGQEAAAPVIVRRRVCVAVR